LSILAKRSEEIETEKEKKLAQLDEVIAKMEAEVHDYSTFKENRHIFIAERDHWKAKRDL
jgi:translation initiation factor IF-3